MEKKKEKQTSWIENVLMFAFIFGCIGGLTFLLHSFIILEFEWVMLRICTGATIMFAIILGTIKWVDENSTL